jgi:hypothetical protein
MPTCSLEAKDVNDINTFDTGFEDNDDHDDDHLELLIHATVCHTSKADYRR